MRSSLRNAKRPLGQRTYAFRAADPLGGPPLRQLTSINLRLEPFGASREKAVPLLNMRVGKKLNFGRHELQLSLDALNVINSNSVKVASYVSGPSFGNVTDVMPPRQIRFGVQARSRNRQWRLT